jgi:MFS transporter, DHA1 family, tetracycline resistance protein
MTGGTGKNKQLSTLFLITFINLVGFGIVLPVFPFFGSLVGASPAQTTLAMAAYSVGQFVGAPFWGKLSDKYGRRPVLVACLIGAILSYLLMAHARDIWTLGISRLVCGLMAGNIAAAFAYVGDITTAENRPKAMGMIGAAFGMGFIFGPGIGGLIAGASPDLHDFEIIGYASAAVTAVALIAAIFLLPESLNAERRAEAHAASSELSARQLLRDKPVIWALMALTLFVIGSASMMETTIAFFAHDAFQWGPRDVGLIFAGVGIISAALQAGAAGPLARKYGSGNMAITGVVIYGLGLAGLAATASETMMIASLALLSVGLGLFNPAFQTLTSDQTNDGDRGLVMGLTQGASSLGRIIGPSVSGTIYQGIGQRSPFGLGAAVMVLAFAAAIMAARKNNKGQEALV